MSLSFLRFLFGGLACLREVATSYLISSFTSSGKDLMVSSMLQMMSSTRICLGAIANPKPFFRALTVVSSIWWLERLIRVSLCWGLECWFIMEPCCVLEVDCMCTSGSSSLYAMSSRCTMSSHLSDLSSLGLFSSLSCCTLIWLSLRGGWCWFLSCRWEMDLCLFVSCCWETEHYAMRREPMPCWGQGSIFSVKFLISSWYSFCRSLHWIELVCCVRFFGETYSITLVLDVWSTMDEQSWFLFFLFRIDWNFFSCLSLMTLLILEALRAMMESILDQMSQQMWEDKYKWRLSA